MLESSTDNVFMGFFVVVVLLLLFFQSSTYFTEGRGAPICFLTVVRTSITKKQLKERHHLPASETPLKMVFRWQADDGLIALYAGLVAL